MATPLTFRQATITKPTSTTTKNAPLSNVEIDGNMHSIQDAITVIESDNWVTGARIGDSQISPAKLSVDYDGFKTKINNHTTATGLVVSECQPWSTAEQFELLQAYLGARHPGGGMTQMDEVDFADMVEHTPVTSFVTEYREPGDGITPGRLVGACLTDRQGDGLSMVYSFFDPAHEARAGLGNYIILDHISRAAQMGLPYVYLGYWVEQSERMQYKIRYRPLERLGREGWERIDDAEQDRLVAAIAGKSRKAGAGDPGSPGTKDNLPLGDADPVFV